MNRIFDFPDPVNETSARIVAGGVVVLTVAYLLTRSDWLLWVIAYGFVARVLTGPIWSPLGQLVTRVITPRMKFEHRFVPGPPKRFAQAIGMTLSVGALVAVTIFDAPTVAAVLIYAISAAASLEAAFGFCLGCVIFNRLMKVGLIPDSICEACASTAMSLGTIEPRPRLAQSGPS
jgi:hypothetical protein